MQFWGEHLFYWLKILKSAFSQEELKCEGKAELPPPASKAPMEVSELPPRARAMLPGEEVGSSKDTFPQMNQVSFSPGPDSPGMS